jgi:hypothetical protein
MSCELTFDLSQGTKAQRNSVISSTSLIHQTLSGLPLLYTSSSSVPLFKRESWVNGDVATDRAFLFPLFNRADYLLTSNEPEDEKEKDRKASKKIEIDPWHLQRTLHYDIGRDPLPSSKQLSQSQRPSPCWRDTTRSICSTQFIGRQSIVNTTRIHPNLKISDLLGHVPFPISIGTDCHPADTQDTQMSNLFLPPWAMLPTSTVPDPGSLNCAFSSILQEAANLKNTGVPIEHIIETHPNIAALFDEDVFRSSGILSKWAVGMVHGMLLKGMNRQNGWHGMHPLAYSHANSTRQYLFVLWLHVSLLVPNALDDLPLSRNLSHSSRMASSVSEPTLYAAY